MSDLFPRGSAILSPCETYRYRLSRDSDARYEPLAWIMVNPSTADALADDATIRKVRGFTQRLDYRWFIVGNKFAYRATDIRALRSAVDPIGPENDAHLLRIMLDARKIVVAWGPLAKLPPSLRNRWRAIAETARLLDRQLWCLGRANDGHPLHPLMLAYDTPLEPWCPPA